MFSLASAIFADAFYFCCWKQKYSIFVEIKHAKSVTFCQFSFLPVIFSIAAKLPRSLHCQEAPMTCTLQDFSITA